MSSSSRAPLIIISAAFLFLGALFVYLGGSTLLEQQRYQQQGVRVEAIATGKTLRRATTTSDTAYEISYQFKPSEGAPYEQTESVTVPIWEGVERGSTLTVEYVAGTPATARVVGDRSENNTIAIGALGLGIVFVLIVLIGGGALFRSRSRSVTAPEVPEPAGSGTNVPASQQPSFWPLARKSFGFWFGAVALLVGLPWFIVNGALPSHANWRFAREGLATTGIVLTKEIRSSGRGGNRTEHYEATYRFAVSGETIEGRDELSREDWERLIEREPANVLYRPGKPSSNRLAGDRPWILQTVFGLVGLIFAVAGSTVLVRSARSAKLEWHLRQNGVRSPGTVTDLHDLNLKLNGARQWRLQYEYRDFRGQSHLKTLDLPQHEAQAWQPGDVGAVLYDSTRPADAVWLGRDESR